MVEALTPSPRLAPHPSSSSSQDSLSAQPSTDTAARIPRPSEGHTLLHLFVPPSILAVNIGLVSDRDSFSPGRRGDSFSSARRTDRSRRPEWRAEFEVPTRSHDLSATMSTPGEQQQRNLQQSGSRRTRPLQIRAFLPRTTQERTQSLTIPLDSSRPSRPDSAPRPLFSQPHSTAAPTLLSPRESAIAARRSQSYRQATFEDDTDIHLFAEALSGLPGDIPGPTFAADRLVEPAFVLPSRSTSVSTRTRQTQEWINTLHEHSPPRSTRPRESSSIYDERDSHSSGSLDVTSGVMSPDAASFVAGGNVATSTAGLLSPMTAPTGLDYLGSASAASPSFVDTGLPPLTVPSHSQMRPHGSGRSNAYPQFHHAFSTGHQYRDHQYNPLTQHPYPATMSPSPRPTPSRPSSSLAPENALFAEATSGIQPAELTTEEDDLPDYVQSQAEAHWKARRKALLRASELERQWAATSARRR